MKVTTSISLFIGALLIGFLIGTYKAPECRNSNHENVLNNNISYLEEMNKITEQVNDLYTELEPYIKEKEQEEKYQQKIENIKNQVEFLIENDPWFRNNIAK